MNEKKLTLIQQLLAKAESTTPEEAEALTEAAERLMVKHGVDQAMIDARRSSSDKPESVIELQMTFKGLHATGMYLMAAEVMAAFDTIRLLGSGRDYRRHLFIIGFESDAQQAKTLLASLELQAIVAMRAWWKGARIDYAGATEHGQRMAKRSFLAGFGQGAANRIRKTTAEVVAEAEASAPGTELALLSRKDQVDVWTAQAYPSVGRGRGFSVGNGYSAGSEAGARANTGERSLKGTAAITA